MTISASFFFPVPSYSQYYETMTDFMTYMDCLNTGGRTAMVIERVKTHVNSIFLSNDWRQILEQVVREKNALSRSVENSEVAVAVLERVEAVPNTTVFGRSVEEIKKDLYDLGSYPESLDILGKIGDRVTNLPMDSVDYRIMVGVWTIFDSAPNDGTLGKAISSVRDGIRSLRKREIPKGQYRLNLAKAGELWGRSYSNVSDLFSTKTDVGGQIFKAPTNMVGQTEQSIRFIAYDRADGSNQADIARYCKPGEVMIGIKHHSPEPSFDQKEQLKLQCTHAQLVVGYRDGGQAKACTLNNPQGFNDGGFAYPTQAVMFVKPIIPSVISDEKEQAYIDNIRTWATIANTFSHFPGDYNGNDPLGTRSLLKVKTFGEKALQAMTGDEAAKDWLRRLENQLYCSEMVHISLNLGLYFPLNRKTIGDDVFDNVRSQIESGQYLVGNANPHVSNITRTMAPEFLNPIGEELKLNPADVDAEPFSKHMALEPMTSSDIIDIFIMEILPRRTLGEEIAPLQAATLEGLYPALKEFMEYDNFPDSVKAEVDNEFNNILSIMGTRFASYYDFRNALNSQLRKARHFTGGVDGSGVFIPPHSYMIRAKQNIVQEHNSGVLDWQYIGHGMHASILDRI